MKKLVVAALTAVASVMLLTGCCVKHEWVPATCAAPETCGRCGEVRGEKLEHTWVDATCTAAKTCSVCGETEGEPLGHTWQVATVEKAKTCSVCGETEGSPVEFSELDFTALETFYCDYADVINDERIVACNEDGGNISYTILDFDGNEIKKIDIDLTHEDGSYSGYAARIIKDYLLISYPTAYATSNCDVVLEFYNQDGEQALTISLPIEEVPFKFIDGTFPAVRLNGARNKIEVGDTMFETIVGAYDIESSQWSDAANYQSDVPDATSELNIEDYEVVSVYSVDIDGYLAKDLNGQWCYVDRTGNVLATYADATDFTAQGYALVSADGTNYDLIDKDFNIIGKDVVSGESAYLYSGTAGFVVFDGEFYRYYKVR